MRTISYPPAITSYPPAITSYPPATTSDPPAITSDPSNVPSVPYNLPSVPSNPPSVPSNPPNATSVPYNPPNATSVPSNLPYDPSDPFSEEIPITLWMSRNGIKRQSPGFTIACGMVIANAYRKYYGVSPVSRRQWCDGAMRDIRHYTQKHYDAIDIPSIIRGRLK